jgi:hypothetical protein
MRAVACGCEDIHEGGVRRHLALYSTCERLVVPDWWKIWAVQVDDRFDVPNCSFHEESALDISFNHAIYDSNKETDDVLTMRDVYASGSAKTSLKGETWVHGPLAPPLLPSSGIYFD